MIVPILILFTSSAVSLVLLVRLWQVRQAPGAPWLMVAFGAVALWSCLYAFEILFPDLQAKVLCAKLEYLGIAFAPVGMFIFSLQYGGHAGWATRNRLLALSLVPAITVSLVSTNEAHHLIWTSTQLVTDRGTALLAVTHGWWFWVHTGYSYVMLVAATYFLLRVAIESQRLFQAQALVMLGGMLIPWAANLLYLTRLNPFPSLDITPVAFMLTCVALSVSTFRFRMMDVNPVARASIMSAMSDGVIALDGKDRVVEINPAAERILAPQPHAPIGRPIGELWPELAQAIDPAHGASGTIQEISRQADGERRIYNLRVTPVLDRRGRATGRLVLLSDTTELKRSQEQVLLQATALESAENGILITDTAGKILWVNPAFSRLTGYPSEEALGQTPRLLKSGHQSSEVYRDLWATVLAGRVWRGEMVNRRKDGHYYSQEMTITPLTGPDGAPTHFITIQQDISTRKYAEEALRMAHQEAVEANRMKTQLLANVSHDLRTPLGAILGFADMLRSGVYGQLRPEQGQAAGEIIDSANQLLMFVNNLIGQAQIETGRIMLKNRPFAAAELVDVARSTGGMLATKKGLALECEVAPDLPDPLPGDVYWLRQVVLNLVNNAVKFTEQGSVRVRLCRASPDTWAIEVSDTGVGIPVDAQARVFEAFEQVDGSATRKYGGSGLGLSIVKQLTALMGGKIEVQSEVGRGTSIRVCLPLAASRENHP
jgi:PAS domain S-box-containing protein